MSADPNNPEGLDMLALRRKNLAAYQATAREALAALIAKLPVIDREGEVGVPWPQEHIDKHMADLATSAYAFADFMLLAEERLTRLPPEAPFPPMPGKWRHG